MTELNQHPGSPWPHRLAVLLACATFPLIWVGGLVTTYDAGMAVPDWPTTYGYNLFLYPWQTWLLGPWDLFIEHGHRLLGALAGLLTIALVFVLMRWERRRWVQYLGTAALAAVVLQGVLGGLRVLMDQRQLAMIHACTGPAFFALSVALAVCTSKTWKNASLASAHGQANKLHTLAGSTLVIAYLQLILGAQLRHISAGADPRSFQIVVFFHLLMAAALAVHVALLTVRVCKHHRQHKLLTCTSVVLAGLMAIQLVLGPAAWVVKYAWPAWAWLAEYRFVAAYTVEAQGLSQSLTVTAHVATGSLILVTSVAAALCAFRLVRPLHDEADAADGDAALFRDSNANKLASYGVAEAVA